MPRLGPVYAERPKSHRVNAQLKARFLFRWLSHHTDLSVWVLGTSRWSILLVRDRTNNSTRTAQQSLAEVMAEGN